MRLDDRARLSVDLAKIASLAFRDASALARAIAWLNDPTLAPARIGGVLHRYATEHKQAYSELVGPIAEEIRRLSDGPRNRAVTARRRRLAGGGTERGGVVYLAPRLVRSGEGDDNPPRGGA
jgi:hypothetical protein